MGFARLSVLGMSIALGVVCALFIFLVTAILLLNADPGDPYVGFNLKSLWIFIPGYSVSWLGGLIGAAMGGLVGIVLGFSIAVLWNLTHYVYIGLVVIRALWWRMMAD